MPRLRVDEYLATTIANRSSNGWLQHLGSVIFAMSLLGAVVGALAPSSLLGWLRTVVPGFAPAWDWLDASLPGLNPLHVIVFAWVAFLWRMLAPRGSVWRVPVALLALGIVCEWLQQFVPARQPRLTDVLSDAIGIAIGWGVAIAINRMRRG